MRKWKYSWIGSIFREKLHLAAYPLRVHHSQTYLGDNGHRVPDVKAELMTLQPQQVSFIPLSFSSPPCTTGKWYLLWSVTRGHLELFRKEASTHGQWLLPLPALSHNVFLGSFQKWGLLCRRLEDCSQLGIDLCDYITVLNEPLPPLPFSSHTRNDEHLLSLKQTNKQNALCVTGMEEVRQWMGGGMW